jgi:hypothetical protein
MPQKKYQGETALLVFQNLHRFTLYIALGFVAILSYDGVISLFRGGEFGIGVGSVILLVNPLLLAGYAFGCHAFRHLAGGKLDCFACPSGEQNNQVYHQQDGETHGSRKHSPLKEGD